MPNTLAILLAAAVVGLTICVIIQGRRLSRLRRRARRAAFIGPEAHVRLQKQLFELRARQDCRERGITPSLPLQFRSEYGEDTLLYELFDGRPTGVFIEVGALDGRRLSVSWIFEAIGWKGLLVEPVPERFEECRRNRPGSTVVRAALGPAGATGSTTFVVPIDPEHQGSSHRADEGMGSDFVKGLERSGEAMRKIDVPLTWVDRELQAAGFDRVDFASIDVEGAEMDVLQGFDLDKHRPRVIVIEDLSLGKSTRVSAYLEERGYRQVMWIGGNRVMVRSDDEEMLRRATRAAETVYSPFFPPKGLPDAAPHDVR